MGADALGVIAHAAGFIVTHVVDMHDRVIAVLTAANRGGVDREPTKTCPCTPSELRSCVDEIPERTTEVVAGIC
jgi:hypothetical protein